MKKILLSLVFLFVIGGTGSAMAAPKWVDVIPSADINGNVTIPLIPAGATLLNVEIYDDVKGTKPKLLGAISRFKLEPGQGFNFIWEDSEGVWYQMITPQSRALGLTTDCSWINPATGQPACKYLFPAK